MKKILSLIICMSLLCACTAQSSAPGSDSASALPSSSVPPSSSRAESYVYSEEENLAARVSAEILTPKLLYAASGELSQPNFDYMYFICRLTYNADHPDFYYYNIFPADSYNRIFKCRDIDRVLYEVFGAENPDHHQYPIFSENYQPENQQHVFSTDFGWGFSRYQTSRFMTSWADDKTVTVAVNITRLDSSSGDPDYTYLGEYNAIFDRVVEDGHLFLRFNRFEKSQNPVLDMPA